MLIAEQTFVQINFQVVLMQSHEYLFQGFQVFLMGVSVDQHVIDVDENVS